MFPTSIPQKIIISNNNLHYSRRLLYQLFLQPSPTTPPQTPPPTYQILDPTHDGSTRLGGFDANIVMILAVLVCALICSLCINTFIRCVIKCSSLISGEPTYYLNMINHEKKKINGLDKRALKTFPVIKYSKEMKINGLSNECVICLSEFMSGEKVRILPICNHGFHAKCIDKWLDSHTSCPTCRQSLVDTCNKIIGCEGGDQATSSPPQQSPPTLSREVINVSIVPFEREDLERNYRGEGLGEN